MSQLQITNAGLLYKDQVFAGQEVQNISHFVFANVPWQNETQPIDPNATVPAAHVVKELPVEAVTALDGNAVVISCVMGYDVGDFEFNWYGAIATKANGEKVLIAVVTTATQTKTKTVGTNVGNYSVKSIVWRSQQIAGQLNVSLSALPWQLNNGAFVSKEDFNAHNHDGRYALKENVLTPVPVNAKFTDTHRAITDSLTSTSSSISASANAVRAAYNVAENAQQVANAALPADGKAVNSTLLEGKRIDQVAAYTIDMYEKHHFGGNGETLNLPIAKVNYVSVWSNHGVINFPNCRTGDKVIVTIYNDGAGVVLNTGAYLQYVAGTARGASNHCTKKARLTYECVNNDHWRVTVENIGG